MEVKEMADNRKHLSGAEAEFAREDVRREINVTIAEIEGTSV
jgi:hypothetical protein